MKNLCKSLLLLTTILLCQSLAAQEFLKTYNDPANPNSSVSFECITEKTDSSGNFYVGGHIGDTIALFRINTAGAIVSVYKLKLSPANTRLDAIMLDANGFVVTIGNIQNSSANQGFIFKFNPVLNNIVWFTQTNANDQVVYFDVADKTGTSYIVSGSNAANGSALLMKINKTSGAGPTIGINYIVSGLENPVAMQLSGANIYATGRYALGGGTNGFRFCMSRINATSFVHLGTTYYAVPKYPTGTARMYSTDIFVSGNQAVMVGNGDDKNIVDPYKYLHITKVNTSNGSIIWSQKLDNPAAASDGLLSEIRSDNAGNYAVMGFNVNSGNLTKAMLMSVTDSGNITWNKSYDLYRRSTNVGSSYEYGFTVSGKYIYAVGQNNISGITKGVLLKVNTTNGNVTHSNNLPCYDSFNIKKTKYTFFDTVPVTLLHPVFKSAKQSLKAVAAVIKDSLVCGIIAAPCNCSFSLTFEGSGIFQPFKCRDTIKATCGNAFLTPMLSCSDSSTRITGFSLTDAANNTPSWAVGYSGSGGISIPTGTNGIFTLTYIWGNANGAPCDSCKIYLSVTCCPSCTLSTFIAMQNGTRTKLKCGDTTLLSCKSNYIFNPILSCNNDTATHIVYATLKDGAGNTPSWANTFLSNMGNGALNIPGGVSGYYTLTYYWGFGGTVCSSCSYILKVQCCTGFTVNAGKDITACCVSGGVQLNAVASGGTTAYTYLWSPATGLSNPTIANPISTATGTYAVTVKDALGCTATDTVKIISGGVNCCRIAGNQTKSQVYPNPFTNGFTLKIPANAVADLQIINVYGMLAETKHAARGTIQMGEKLAYGIYTIIVNYKDGTKEQIQVVKNAE